MRVCGRRPYDDFVLFAAYLKALHKTLAAPEPFPWRWTGFLTESVNLSEFDPWGLPLWTQAAFETEESIQKITKIRYLPPGKPPGSSLFCAEMPKKAQKVQKYRSCIALGHLRRCLPRALSLLNQK